MIRFIITLLFVIIFLIISIPIIFVLWLIGFIAPKVKYKGSLVIVNTAFRIVIFLSGAKTTVIGEDRVPKDRAVLYVPNHRSYYDIILTYVRVPRETGYVAKKEMLKVPVFSIWMKFLHCQFLNRDNLKEGLKTILTCIELVKSGVSICIFPEGTRNKTENTFLPFHDGSFKIAEKSNCPIVPIAINNSASLFENQAPKIRKSHVIIEYCEPIYTENLTREEKKELSARVQEVIRTTYEKNQSLV